MRSLSSIPKLDIILGNKAVAPYGMTHLNRIRIYQKLSCPTLCDITFTHVDERFTDSYPCRKGTVMSVALAGDALPLFTGTITATEYSYDATGELSLSVRGYDALYKAGKAQRVYTHVQMTVPEIAGEMIAPHGISVETSHTGPVWEHLVQYKESDLDFLARMAQRSGLYFFINRLNRLAFFSQEGTGEDVFLTRGDNLFEVTVEENDAPALDSVVSFGWNPFFVELHEGHADEGEDKRNRTLVDLSLINSREADAVSRSELERCRLLETTVCGVAEGNTQLAPGTTVSLDGIHSRLNRNYLLTEVDHIFSASTGYISRFSSLPPDFRGPDSGTNATFGIITDINDPDGLGRVKASLPSFEDLETGWMNVVIPGGGDNKGAVMLPDTGDQVLILFLNSDPARGVVLGGIYGTAHQPPDWGIEGNTVKRFCIMTPDGQKVILDDGNEGVKVENHDGSRLELVPGRVRLYSATDLTIEAPGKNITIVGNTIDFKKG